MKYARLIVFTLFNPLVIGLNAQNLLFNPSFERVQPYPNCEHYFEDENILPIDGWFNANIYENDGHAKELLLYYDTVYDNCNVHPSWQEIARLQIDGNVYLRIRHFPDLPSYMKPSYRKPYLSTQLKQPLKANQRYTLTFKSQHRFLKEKEASGPGCRMNGLSFSFTHQEARDDQTIENGFLLHTDTVTYRRINDYWSEGRIIFEPDTSYRFFAFGSVKESIKKGTCSGYGIDDLYLAKYEPTQEQLNHIRLRKIADRVRFGKGNTRLTEQAKAILDSSFVPLQHLLTPSAFLLISGHTDNTGTPKENLVLSQKRAEAIKAFLVEKGIPATQIITRGYGDRQPIADNTTAAGRAQNRRVALKLLSPKNVKEVIFEPLTWEQALEKSQKTGNPVFLDAYTTWCKPCKLMDREVFTDSTLAHFFNTNFVNLKMDMETREGKRLVEKYEIKGYPTLLFANGEGEVLSYELGYKSAEELLAMGKEVLKKKKEQKNASMRERFLESPCELKTAEYIYLESDLEKKDSLVQLHIACIHENERFSKENLEFLLSLAISPDDTAYKFFQSHRAGFEKNYGDSLIAFELAMHRQWAARTFWELRQEYEKADSLPEKASSSFDNMATAYQRISDRVDEVIAEGATFERPVSSGTVRMFILGKAMNFYDRPSTTQEYTNYVLKYLAPEHWQSYYANDSYKKRNLPLKKLELASDYFIKNRANMTSEQIDSLRRIWIAALRNNYVSQEQAKNYLSKLN